MLAQTRGVVAALTTERPGAQEIVVRVRGGLRSAIVYPALTGRVAVGDAVILNTWAVEMGLGTGGLDIVVATFCRRRDAEAPGHIMKLRYTPEQVPVLAAESPESPYHDGIAEFETLQATPVVCAELHSQIPAIAAAAKWETRGEARIVYVMTDAAALPLGLSRLVHAMSGHGLIDAVVTAGQAFGGDYEAVNVYSALAVARVAAEADIIIVCQGPGNTGTDTRLGFSGLDQGIALNAVASLDGTPIAVARLSFVDPRPRHVGLSHHTLTILQRVARCCALVPVPKLGQAESSHLRRALETSGLLALHEFITVNAEPGLDALLDTGLQVDTMGRGLQEERAFFLAASSAGLVAGQWFTGTRDNWMPVHPRHRKPQGG